MPQAKPEGNWHQHEDAARQQGYQHICGIDEAGRGPLAGPVCAAAVVLPEGLRIPGLNDSKKLTEKRREALYDIILDQALDTSIAFASEAEIDEINILQATFLAMRRALAGLQQVPDFALVDGNRDPGLCVPVQLIIKGDQTSASIAAASILAKVARDRLLYQLDEQYPQYAFAKHKGYGTKLHYERLHAHGVSPVHRRSFLKAFFQAEAADTKPTRGQMGERYAAQYLRTQGYEILTANYRTRFGEIDLIVQNDAYICFTEVKARSADCWATPAAAVDVSKQQKLAKAAMQYLQENQTQRQPRFDVVEVIFNAAGTAAQVRLLPDAFILEEDLE